MQNAKTALLKTCVVVMFFFTMLLGITGCGKECTDTTAKFELPKELEGYRIYRLQGSGMETTLYVIIPPDTMETKPIYLTESRSKSPPTVMIIDGKRYKLVEEEE